MTAFAELHEAIELSEKHGRTPKSGNVVADAYRAGRLNDIGIGGLHVIGELLDRIDALHEEIEDMHKDAAGPSI